MPEISDFRLGADVVSSDGEKVGFLASVLVDEEGFDPRAIVAREETSLFARLLGAERMLVTDEVVVQIAAVDSADGDAVRLSLSSGEVRRQPAYLSYRFRPLSPGEALLEEAQTLTTGVGAPNVEEVANKPADQIEIDRGESVMLGDTGRRLGGIADVLYDRGEIVGVVIKPEGFFKHEVVLPIRFISRADDLALFARLDQAGVERLEPFAPGEEGRPDR
jgi:uncharacterized protein YrrD